MNCPNDIGTIPLQVDQKDDRDAKRSRSDFSISRSAVGTYLVSLMRNGDDPDVTCR